MKMQLSTLAIALAFSTAGCAGFGLQQGSNLGFQFRADQGLDQVWGSSTEHAPAQELETPLYADQELGTLWDSAVRAPAPGGQPGFYESRTAGDLWLSGSAPSKVLAQ
ncbi:MAG: hypothetical protein WCE62_13785 [Polyangiales bacterium]